MKLVGAHHLHRQLGYRLSAICIVDQDAICPLVGQLLSRVAGNPGRLSGQAVTITVNLRVNFMYKSIPVNSNCLFCYTSRHYETGQVSEKNSDFEDLLRMFSLETGRLFIHFQKLMMYALSDFFTE